MGNVRAHNIHGHEDIDEAGRRAHALTMTMLHAWLSLLSGGLVGSGLGKAINGQRLLFAFAVLVVIYMLCRSWATLSAQGV